MLNRKCVACFSRVLSSASRSKSKQRSEGRIFRFFDVAYSVKSLCTIHSKNTTHTHTHYSKTSHGATATNKQIPTPADVSENETKLFWDTTGWCTRICTLLDVINQIDIGLSAVICFNIFIYNYK